jgi:hypothetical protein
MFADSNSNNMNFVSLASFEPPSDAATLPCADEAGVFPRPPPRGPGTNTMVISNATSAEKDDTNTNVTTNEAGTTQVDDTEMMQMMAAVNDQLEHELSETKTTVKRILKELVALQTVSAEVHAQWTPLQETEHQEAARLNELQSEVHGSVGMALPQHS